MARYYFEPRDGDELIIDEEVLELRDTRAVQREAALCLSGFARDSVGSFNGA